MYSIIIFSIIIVLSFSTPAFAHDCWLQPDKFYIGLEALLFARLVVGHRMKPEKELPLEKAMTPRLELFTNKGCIGLLPLFAEGDIPAVKYHHGVEGPGLLVMDRDFTAINLNNEKFSTYLTHEMHTELLPMVEFSSHDEQKERYARCMKALIQVGDNSDGEIHDKVIGQKLEIILDYNPCHCKPGDFINITVLFEGRPLAGRYVTIYQKNLQSQVSEKFVKTDQNGRAAFRVNGPGICLIRLVHLYPCPDNESLDWESYWSSFCFEIPISSIRSV